MNVEMDTWSTFGAWRRLPVDFPARVYGFDDVLPAKVFPAIGIAADVAMA